MKEFITHQHRRVGHALRGFCTALHADVSVRLQVALIPLYAGFAWAVWPLTDTEILFLALSFTLLLVTELQNTSFEKALDRLHPELHEDIGDSKDIAASAVLTAGLFALLVVLIIGLNRWM